MAQAILILSLVIAAYGGSLVVTACGSSASQVQVKGDDNAVIALAGEWEGTYTGADPGRQGTIHFHLTVGRHTAEGNVLMRPAGAVEKPQPLQIRFVEVDDGGTVSGKIGPYRDPQCHCMMEAEFIGKLSGDVIEGLFTTSQDGGKLSQQGRWSAHRK